jgi:hypothetical protein
MFSVASRVPPCKRQHRRHINRPLKSEVVGIRRAPAETRGPFLFVTYARYHASFEAVSAHLFLALNRRFKREGAARQVNRHDLALFVVKRHHVFLRNVEQEIAAVECDVRTGYAV